MLIWRDRARAVNSSGFILRPFVDHHTSCRKDGIYRTESSANSVALLQTAHELCRSRKCSAPVAAQFGEWSAFAAFIGDRRRQDPDGLFDQTFLSTITPAESAQMHPWTNVMACLKQRQVSRPIYCTVTAKLRLWDTPAEVAATVIWYAPGGVPVVW